MTPLKIFTYNELLNHINNSEEDDLIEWKFKAIREHDGPLPRSDPNYNGSHLNLRIEWEMGRLLMNPSTQ